MSILTVVSICCVRRGKSAGKIRFYCTARSQVLKYKLVIYFKKLFCRIDAQINILIFALEKKLN